MANKILTPQEQLNMKTFESAAVLAQNYAAKEISAQDFVQELVKYVTDDVVFRSNYTPSWEPLRPLFTERRGIQDFVERYDYEHKAEQFKEGVPTDFAISGDVAYYSQHETASFFNKQDVTRSMVTRLKFDGGRIASLEMFLDFAPIEEAYGDN